MKSHVMYALYSGRKGTKVPLGIFASKWKAQEAYHALWNIRAKPVVVPMWVEQPNEFMFTLYAHEYKRVETIPTKGNTNEADPTHPM